MAKDFSFFENVHDVVREIPRGRATSYGAIAKYLGAAKASRMVGFAMNAAHGDDSIPAHRVVNRIGVLSGKNNFSPPTRMQDLLEAEGVVVKDDQIQNFKDVFWDPVQELNL